jgi:hypothetical protein
MKAYLGNTVLVHRPKWASAVPGFHWTYAEPGGGLVLAHETHWNKINGVVWNSRHVQVWVQFRRKYRPRG